MEKIPLEISGVNVKRGLEICDGSLDIYVDVLRSYVIDIQEALEKMQNVSGETLDAYSTTLHGVKGISQAIGAEEAGKTALLLEEMADRGDLTGVLAKNSAFMKYAENLANEIQVWLEKFDAA